MRKWYHVTSRSPDRNPIRYLLLLFCLLTLALTAGNAAASVDFVNQWPATPVIVSNGAASPVTGKFSVGAGSNRLMLVAVATEYSAAQTPTITVTYGGQPVTNIATATNTAQNSKIWVGYLNEAGIVAAGTNKTLSVTPSITANLTALYATAAVFTGVNQSTPISGSGNNASASTAALLSVSAAYNVSGVAGNNGMSVYVANWNGQTSTAGGGHTELRDYAGTSFNLAAGYTVVTTGTTTPGTTPAAAAGGAIAGVGLAPIALAGAPNANTTCGDCHGYPPNDGTARNTPPGLFQGTHEKHAGGNDLQYGYACTSCHYNAGGFNHSSKFKNITGSKLPGNAYSLGKSIAITNSTGNGTCSNTSCHSTGRTNVQYTPSPGWTSPGITCLSCHAGRASALGAQANSTAGFKLSSSHSQHLKYPAANMNCNHCHGSVATNAATLKTYTGVIYHANGTNNVVFKDLAYGTYTAFKTGTKTCANVSCHGGKSRGGWQNQSINTDNTCVHCHGVAGTSTADTNRNKYAPGWGGTGTSTDQNTANTDMRVGSHFVHLSSVYIKKMKCNECHIVPLNAFDGTHMTGPRYSSQTVTFSQASTANKNSVTPAVTPGSAVASASCTTTFCHGSSMPKGDTGGTDKSPTWNANLTTGTPGAAECARCHGNPPTFGLTSSVHIGSAATISCTGCHKNVTNATGNIINKALHLNGAINTLVDTATSSACNKCHGNPPQGAVVKYGRYSGLVKDPKTLALGASPANMGAHKKHADSGLSCNACHNNYSVSHPDSKMQVFFRISSNTISGWNATSPRAPYGTYSGNSGGITIDTSSTLIRTTASTNNSCNTYCHGGWTNSNRNMNPRWTSGAAATACGTCHGATALNPPLMATHARHAGYSSAQTARQGYSFACTKCHPSRTAGNHIKGTVHVRFSTAVLGNSANYTKTGATQEDSTLPDFRWRSNKLAGDTPDGTCSNISCHSNARATGMGTTQYATTAQWGNTTRNCLGCHGGRNGATGAPARSSANFTLSTTHSQHLKYPAANINCQTCHAKVAVNAATLKNFSGVKLHVNGVRNIAFGGVLYGSYTSYKSTEAGSSGNTKTCTNISCHGGKSRSAWSSTAQNNDHSCAHCHGVAGTSSALPNIDANRKYFAPGWGGTGISTDGISVNTDVRVGGHFVHLSSVYMKKLKCNECHTVPSSPFDGTHMATTRFNSQSLSFTQASTATKNSVIPAFTSGGAATPANCTTTFCHGSSMPRGDTSGTDKSPSWNANLTTGTPGTSECARCHGNPPTAGTTSGVHSGVTATTGCSGCHPQVVNGTGAIINKTLHMDGSVQAITACNGCHDYDTNGGTWGLVKNQNYGGTAGVEGRGAHYKHIEYLKTRYAVTLNPNTDTYGNAAFNAVCGACHSQNTADHTTGAPANSRTINFGGSAARQFGGSTPLYNGQYNTSSGVNPKSCSNLDCHYRTSPIWATY